MWSLDSKDYVSLVPDNINIVVIFGELVWTDATRPVRFTRTANRLNKFRISPNIIITYEGTDYDGSGFSDSYINFISVPVSKARGWYSNRILRQCFW